MEPRVKTALKRIRLPAYEPYGVDLSNDGYRCYTIKDPNELSLKWLSMRGDGLTIVLFYTNKSARSTVKCVKRFKRTARKALGRKAADDALNRLSLNYIWAENGPELLEAYKRMLFKALDEAQPSECWAFVNPAGLSRGLVSDA